MPFCVDAGHAKNKLEYGMRGQQPMDFAKLQSVIKGRVLLDRDSLNYYSVDSSFYRVRPTVVVIPKTAQDVISVVRFARKNRIPITARGGGTGLVGSALGSGIIIDLQNFGKVRVSKNHVEVGAGVHKGKLDQILDKHGKFLGPNPSVGPYCTIGGMIGTNASGSRSLKYGSTINNLLEVKMVTAQGKLLKLPSRSKPASSILQIARLVDRSDYPAVSKNSCGYRLDAVDDVSNTQKIVAASEGTLGIILSAKLSIHDLPEKRSLIILGYSSPKKAALDCQKIILLRPSALEFVDHNTMRNIDAKFPPRTKCLLYVEFDSKTDRMSKALAKTCSGKTIRILNDRRSIERWWSFRNSALYFSLKNVLSKEALPHIIEDAAVPLERLVDLMSVAERLRKKFKVKLVMYGHAGNGNLHIRMASKSKNARLVHRLAHEFFSEVISIGGTITAEHGDGIARSKFVKRQYNKRTYELFRRIKAEFDPQNLLNPHKILTD